MHDLSRNETVTLASGEPGGGGPGLYVASSDWVVWDYYDPFSAERPDQLWVYSMSTGEMGELVPLAGYQVLALAGNTLVISRTWSSYGGVEQFFTYDLISGELRPFDKESNQTRIRPGRWRSYRLGGLRGWLPLCSALRRAYRCPYQGSKPRLQRRRPRFARRPPYLARTVHRALGGYRHELPLRL